jgi:hypothetical protein
MRPRTNTVLGVSASQASQASASRHRVQVRAVSHSVAQSELRRHVYASRYVHAQLRVIVAHAELMTAPGDEERVV